MSCSRLYLLKLILSHWAYLMLLGTIEMVTVTIKHACTCNGHYNYAIPMDLYVCYIIVGVPCQKEIPKMPKSNGRGQCYLPSRKYNNDWYI